MSTTFCGVPLPNASKLSATPQIALTDELLLSGLHSIQSNPNIGLGATFKCLGTWDQYKAILGQVGVKGTLVTEVETYANCYISGLKPLESDSVGRFYFDVDFKQETVV